MDLKVYKRHEVPREIAAQIRSYGRIQWPFVQGQSGSIWDYTVRDDAPMHFVLMKDEVVVSHACVNWREIEFVGEKLICYGLSTVFTYPAFRKGGFAKQVVTEATNSMRHSPGDLALLFCSRPTSLFYIPLGWNVIEEAQILYGPDRAHPLRYQDVTMTLPVTAKGIVAIEKMKHHEMHVGSETW